MVKEVNPRIHVNATDYPVDGHRCEDPEKAKLVKKLALMITDNIPRKLPGGLKENHMDFWILDRLLTKDEVKFMLSFKKRRVGKTTKELAELNGMTVEEAQKVVDKLIGIGILEQNRDNPDRHIQYWVPKWVVGSGEYMVEHPTLPDEHPEVATMFNLAPQEPLELAAKLIPPGGAGIGMHVIPVEKAIDVSAKSESVEHLSHWLQKYDKFCTMVCACRKAQRIRGEGVGDIEGYMCIGVDDIAEYLVESGKDAHYITREEAIEIIERAERKGYVHQITNLDGPERIVGICNCSPGSCYGLRTSQLFNTPNMSRSAYRAHVDTEKCVACGKCVEVCPAGAARLGQKLCKADGSKVKYPMRDLPDDNVWGEDKWDPNYRDTNKINCYDTGTSPCKTACPAHIAVQGYVKMAAEGRYEEAVALIRQDNPFPAVCGDVCNKRCEDRCTRGLVDAPVAIDDIKKFLCQWELKNLDKFVPICDNMDGKQWTEFPIAVIGSGPAGLSAAYYLRMDGYPVTVFEKNSVPGGMLTTGLPSFRLEKDVINGEIEILRRMGVEFKCGVEVGKDVTIPQLREKGYKAFFLGIGLQSGGKLGVPGDDAEGVIAGIDFMRKVNGGAETAVNGDGGAAAAAGGRAEVPSANASAFTAPQPSTQPAGRELGRVVVIGGGNIGADVARTAVRCGAASVDLYCLESYEDMPMGEEDRSDCEAEGITIHAGWGQTEVLAEGGKARGINFRKCLSVRNAEGRFAPLFDDAQTLSAECDTVLYCIGQRADWGKLLEGTKVELNPNGTVKADPVTLQTAEPDIFAGGDVLTGQKFVIDAVAGGRCAMVSINRFVHPGQSLTIGRDLRQFIELNRDDVFYGSYDNAGRQKPGTKAGRPEATFSDLREALTEAQVKIESSRCLKCGATWVDLNQCIGCGLCTTRCQFDAIHLTRDLPHASDMHLAEDMMKVVGPYALKRGFKILKKKITGKSDYPTVQE